MRVLSWALLVTLTPLAHGVPDSFSPSSLTFGRSVDPEGKEASFTQGSPYSSRFTPAVAREVATMILEINPNMALYPGEMIKVHLPGFTACGIMSKQAAQCNLESIGSRGEMVPTSKLFAARWSGAEEVVTLTVIGDMVIAAGPIRVEVVGAITIPTLGVTGTAGIRFDVHFSSSQRPTGVSPNIDPNAARNDMSMLFDTLSQIGSFSQLAVSFDSTATTGRAVALTLQFMAHFNISAAEEVYFHLPAFGGAPNAGIGLQGSSASLWNASWGTILGRGISSTQSDAGYAPDLPSTYPSYSGEEEGTTITLTASAPIEAGTLISVTVPVSAGVKLPYVGVCTPRDVASLMVESNALAGPVNPISITKYGGHVTVTDECGVDPPMLVAPKLVHLGHEIIVEWHRPVPDGSEDINDPTQQSQQHDWIGLFKKGHCKQPVMAWGPSESSNDRAQLYRVQAGTAQFANKCHLATRSVSVNGAQRGETSGFVIFYLDDYRRAGEYEARYFRGDSPGGNGIVCRGLPSLDYSSLGGTTVQCMVEAAAESGVISVEGSPNKARCEGIPSGPDMYRC